MNEWLPYLRDLLVNEGVSETTEAKFAAIALGLLSAALVWASIYVASFFWRAVSLRRS